MPPQCPPKPMNVIAASMSKDEMIEILRSGGWVMIMLAILALILYVSAFDLIYYMYRTNLVGRSQKRWLRWIKHPEEAEGRVGDIIRYTQFGKADESLVRRRFDEIRFSTMLRVRCGAVFLKTLVAAAPLAGLLGTVMGMLSTFQGIATGGRGETMSKVAGGIKEALITTQTGLMVALPGVFVVLIIRSRKRTLEAALARLESLTLFTLFGKAPKKGTLST